MADAWAKDASCPILHPLISAARLWNGSCFSYLLMGDAKKGNPGKSFEGDIHFRFACFCIFRCWICLKVIHLRHSSSILFYIHQRQHHWDPFPLNASAFFIKKRSTSTPSGAWQQTHQNTIEECERMQKNGIEPHHYTIHHHHHSQGVPKGLFLHSFKCKKEIRNNPITRQVQGLIKNTVELQPIDYDMEQLISIGLSCCEYSNHNLPAISLHIIAISSKEIFSAGDSWRSLPRTGVPSDCHRHNFTAWDVRAASSGRTSTGILSGPLWTLMTNDGFYDVF